jgi:hypothetical protein
MTHAHGPSQGGRGCTLTKEPESRIVVLCRPPLNLTGAVRVTGVLGRLPNNEPCITNPTVEGLFDQQGRPVYWLFPEPVAGSWRVLPIPTDPIPPSDPSLVDNGAGISGEVSAYATQEVAKYDTVASLLTTAPPVLSLVEIACKRILSVGDGYIVVGDDDSNSTIKVYTNVTATTQHRVTKLQGVVHTERGRLVLYAGTGPSPFFDVQGPGGGVSLAGPNTVAAAKSTNSASGAAARSLAGARTLSGNPPQIDGGDIDLTGKTVTAVFSQSGAVTSFYIQEPVTGGNGIKVIPQQPCSVAVGDIVDITGTVIESGPTIAECYVEASAIEHTGYRLIPGPAGMSQRTAAGGVFGLQQALYSNTTVTPPIQGAGLSPVGTRVRIWGRVTWKSQDGTVCFVDDGSALKSTYGGDIRAGIRVIWPQDCPSTYQEEDYAEGITGVMGAELSEDDPALPVPVVRVSCGGQGNIIRVKWNSPGPIFDGKTWDTAYHSIQQGINSAASGDEVWVAAGTYEENITLTSGIGVYGSFAGTETVRQAERQWTANLTTIQGDGTDSVVYIGPGATSSTVLDGFTISGGWSHYVEGLYGYYGGGICCNYSSPVISHNVISNNGDGFYTCGGGIACCGGSPTIVNNTISTNHALNGGGIFCSQSSPTIARNLINWNTETQYGGGIYLDSATSAVVRNNTITRNGAAAGGGIYCYNSAGRFSSNTITYNSTNYYNGGGIYCYNYESSAVPQIVNNTVAYNTSPGSGGGIICDSCSPILINNVVASNSSGQVVKYGSSDPAIHTNCIYGELPYSGWYPNPTQDILDDPLLGGVHIQAGSPCLNVGDNSVVQSGDTDIDGQPRKQPIENPNAVVDIGADEWCEADGGVITPVATTELDYFSSLISYCGN